MFRHAFCFLGMLLGSSMAKHGNVTHLFSQIQNINFMGRGPPSFDP